jgi:hypothetical protein
MARRIVVVNSQPYVFSPDDQPPLEGRLWALVRMQVIDELTGQAPASTITVEAEGTGFTPRVASGGLVGLTGIPSQVFPPDVVRLTIRAAGYLPRTRLVQLMQMTELIALHREPTVITGRTVRANGNTTTPLAGATVRVTGIWRTPPPANMDVPADPPNLVSLRPPLYADRAVVTGHLQPRDLTPTVGDDKFLLEDILAGANPIRLSNRQNLAPGDMLLIDADQPDLTEFLAISTITGASTADQPARITLDYPVAWAHRRNAVVKKVSPLPPGAVQQFAVEALAGDTCVFLDDVAGLTAAHEVQITDGTNPDESHSLQTFSATSDTDGYYRLPPLSRVAQLRIHVEKTVGVQTFTSQTEFRPDYNLRENRLDLTLTV